MIVVSSIFWIAGFILSVVMGPTLNLWTWGPAMLCFAVATACAIPDIWRGGMDRLNRFILISGLITLAWFGGRAWFSPVKEFALLDLSLVCMAVSTFIVLHCAFRNKKAQIIIISGIALLLIANLGVMFAEYRNINYRFLIPYEVRFWPAGFFRHYSHCATFLIASSLLLAGFGIRSSWPLFVRAGLIILSIIGISAIYFTKSRSGFIGAGSGLLALVIYWIFIAKREDKKWSGVALISAPVVILGLIAVLIPFLIKIQQTRTAGSSLTDMMDNNIRLNLYGLSLPCITMHPFTGGGSRSFSWEINRFWEIDAMSNFSAEPEHVHNELLQAVTDYGIIGALILLAFIIGVWAYCSFKSLVKGSWSDYENADAWRIGGIAVFIGLFIQSNFEGILRIAPGSILLGMCLAAASHDLVTQASPIKIHSWLHKITLTTCSIMLICILGIYGFKGSNVAIDLWGGVFLSPKASHEDKISAYTKAINKWDLESLRSQRGTLYYELASENPDRGDNTELLNNALEDYKAAISFHPYSPLHPRNAANTLRLLGRSEEASEYYEKAIGLQGGMEAIFKVRLRYAEHLHQVALNDLRMGKYPDAVKNYEMALQQISTFPSYLHGSQFYDFQATIYLNLGLAWEMNKEYEKALAQYEAYNHLKTGYNSYYYIAILYQKRARELIDMQRQSDALRLLIEAEKYLNTNSQLPKDMPASYRAAVIEAVRNQIQELKAQNHVPSAEIRLK